MTFANPFAFLLLVAVIPLVVLYLFKEHRRTLRVSSLLFWQKLEAHPTADKSVRMRRFLSSPMFWLQLILLLLLIGALAQPVWRHSARKVILVLDVSASMQTREASGTRLDHAKQKALKVIDELEGADQAALIAVGLQPRLVADFTDDRRQVRDQIDRLQPLDTGTAMQSALSMVATMHDSSGGLEVVVISDQQPPQAFIDTDSLSVRYRFLTVGAAGANTGFVALEGQASSGLIDRNLLLRNFNTEQIDGVVRIYQEEMEIGSHPVSLPPGGTAAVSIAAIPSDQPVEVVFDGQDSLLVDNRAFLVSSPTGSPKLLVVTDDAAVARLFRQLDHFEVATRSTSAPVPPDERFDMYVYDRMLPAVYPSGGTVILNPPTSRTLNPESEVYDWDTDHPILKDMVMELLPVSGGRALVPPPWMSTLAQTMTHPVVMAGHYEGFRRVIMALAFDRHVENPAMLLLMLKSLDWVNPRDRDEISHIKTGAPYIQAVSDTGEAQITTPEDVTYQIAIRDGMIRFAETSLSGIYTVQTTQSMRYFAANLLDPGESDIRPFITQQASDRSLQLASQSFVSAEYWRWGLWLFIALLLIEWGYFFLRSGRAYP